MWNSKEYEDSVMESWERCETTNGVPYYISHKFEKTQWDHPVMVKTLDDLGDFDPIRYAAYRTAMKLRFLQKRLNLDLIDLGLLSNLLDRYGYRNKNAVYLNCTELEKFLVDLFYSTGRRQLGQTVIDQSAELVLNWLLNLYDVRRVGGVRILSLKVALSTLCSARLHEKYRFYFQQIYDHNNFIDRKKLGILLHDLIQMPASLSEAEHFGGNNVGPAVESVFQNVSGNLGVSEIVFLDWLLKEPQTLVWLPTLHRFAASESVKHEAKCNVCKAYPLLGMRYRCLQCFNLDLCQDCFLTGRVSKKHKTSHPTQEHCMLSTSREDTKAFLKTIKNKLSAKNRKKSGQKSRYLPIEREYGNFNTYSPGTPSIDLHREMRRKARDLASSPDLPEDAPDANVRPKIKSKGSSEEIKLLDENQKDLQNLIHRLDQENRELLDELELLQISPREVDDALEHDYSNRDNHLNHLQQQKELLEAKQEVIQDHNAQLQRQIGKLKVLLQEKSGHNPAQDYSPKNYMPTKHVSPDRRSRPPVPPQLLTPSRPLPQLNSIVQSIANSPLPSYESIIENLRDIAHVTPACDLCVPRDSFPPDNDPVSNIDGAATMRTPKSSDLVSRPRRDSPQSIPGNRDPVEIRTTPDWWDTHVDSSHFSLTSPTCNMTYLTEEQELQDILKQMNETYPSHIETLAGLNSQTDEIYKAAGQMGKALTQFTAGRGRQLHH